MAANEEGGRRTRSGRSAPVVSPPTTRRTRKTTASEDSEIVPELIEQTKEEMTNVDDETADNHPMTVEDESNDADDQFIHIPDGNGVVDNNGIDHVVDEEMADDDSNNNEDQQQSPVPQEDEKNEETPEKELVTEETPPSVVDGAAHTNDVAMASLEEESTENALKRKNATPISDDGEAGEAKKQKPEEKQTNEAVESVAVNAPVPEPVKPHPKLPELEKYWKPVIEDATNFSGWTYLLQYVDQETDVEAAREAYDGFLGNYPYCYGYWRKYADYEKNKGDKSKCEEVFERGLRAIPLSVDLWIHYLNYVKTTAACQSEPAAAEDLVRSQYERALNVCGLEFRSDKLWEAYIKWETEGKRLRRVVKIFDRLLATPTLGYNSHFGSFSDLMRAHPLDELLEADVLKELKQGGEEEKGKNDPTEDQLRNRYINLRKEIHEAAVREVTNRWTFEEGVKRPYFHVKPLERCQLKNWSDYLDYEVGRGDRRRIIVLFERCLIACALYEEYWQRFVRFLMGDEAGAEEKGDAVVDPEVIRMTRDVYERACTIHHKEKPRLHLMWSAFEECHGRIEKAAEILANIDEVAPNLLQVEYRRINVERRRGNYDKCEELFRRYVAAAKNQQVASSLVIKHARFVHKVQRDLDRALEVLRVGQKGDPENVRIPLQMVDLAMQRVEVDEEEVVKILDGVLVEREGLEAEQRVLFAQRKVEFLEDFGRDPRALLRAQKMLQKALEVVQEQKRAKGERGEGVVAVTSVPPPQHPQQQQQNQYANYSSYYGHGDASVASGTAAAAAYGSYSDANYWNYQYSGNNNYGGGGGGNGGGGYY